MLKVLQMLVMTVTVLQKVEFSTCANTCNLHPVPIVGLPGRKGDEGAQGPTGAKGDVGAQGPTGEKGDVGPQGATGAKGDVGPQGPTGAKGDEGAQGPTGAKGDEGAQGPTGAKGDEGAQGPTGAKGDEGAQGPTGAKGDEGAQGPTGAKGDEGAQGPTGAKGDEGAQGPTGAKGDEGAQGPTGTKGDVGPQGAKGDEGQKGSAGENYVGGSIYTRWGRTTCDTTGTELVYAGTAAGTRYGHQGGGANLLCLPDNPVYESFRNGTSDRARLGPVEVHPDVTLDTLGFNDNAPCVVCRTTRPTTMMIPATINCPSGWTREYYGYLMTSDKDENRGTFVCLDRFAQEIPNSQGHTDEAHDLWNVEAYCSIIPCPPYNDYKELTCAVCSK